MKELEYAEKAFQCGVTGPTEWSSLDVSSVRAFVPPGCGPTDRAARLSPVVPAVGIPAMSAAGRRCSAAARLL